MARFEVTGAAGYYYVIDNNTGTEFFKDQGLSKAELEGKASRLNEGYAKIEADSKASSSGNSDTRAGPDEQKSAASENKQTTESSKPDPVSSSSAPETENKTVQPKNGDVPKTSNDDAGGPLTKETPTVTAGQGVGLPNRRQYNPLSDFSSYNYQISLYMVTPEASNRFISSGMTDVGNSTTSAGLSSSGFYLIAQSGGINNSLGDMPGGNKRAPGFELDFYIDDLKFKTFTSLKNEGTATAPAAQFEFNVYEPYGLSFTSKLTTAAKAIQSSSSLPGFEGEANALGQFYVMGIRFYGYDKNGEVVTADQYNGSDNPTTKTDTQALFERFYSLKISSFKFKLDGKMVVYSIQAAVLSMTESFGAKRGQIGSTVTLSGATVGEMLNGKNGLMTKLNKEEADAANKRRKEAEKDKKKKVHVVANSFDVKFEPNSGIEDAMMVDPKDFAKYKATTAMNTASSTKDSNPSAETKATTNKGVRTLAISSGSHMVAAVEQVIKQSSYIKDMMTKVSSALSEESASANGNPAEVAWFTVTPGIEVLGYDNVLNDYAYKITYHIQRYIVPFVRSPMVSKTSTYPGPHKKYQYWYTGKNTEVISYEQNYNNLYFLTGVGTSNESTPPIPKADKPQPGNQTGAQNKAAEAVNSLAVDLYDPGSTVMGKMTIMGDPDYLSQTLGSSMNSVFDKFYGPDGYTINANGGQVFIELDFRAAEDYDSGTNPEVPAGTLSINDNIRYYDYDPSIKDDIKGITFELKWVNSTFSKGKFTQELEMYATNLANFAKKPPEAEKAREPSKSAPKKKKTVKKATQADVRRVDNAIDESNARKERNNVYTSDTGGFDAMGNYTGDYDNGSSNASTASASKQRPDDDNSSSGKRKTAIQQHNEDAARKPTTGRGGARR